MNLLNKLKWILGVALVFVLILVTNQIDKTNFKKVQESVETIYADRLLAKDLIINFTRLLHEKELASAKQNTSFFNSRNIQVNEEIENHLTAFKETKLTKKEERLLQEFESHYTDLKRTERQLINSSATSIEASDLNKIEDQIEVLLNDVSRLSKIQIEEGRRQMMIGRRAIDNMEFFTKIEIYLMVALAICIQLLIIYQPKKDNPFEGYLEK